MKHDGGSERDRWHLSGGRNQVPPTQAVPLSFTCPRHLPVVTCLSLFVLSSAMICRALTPDNPYQAIVGRNVFSLKPPPPPPDPESLVKKEPPPKIKLQGLNTILGRRQVLCKVMMPAKPPERPQPKEESFVMGEGDRQGEIEVLEINMQAESVKFKNHDVVQLLNMKDDADKPVIAAAPPGLPPGGLPGGLPALPPPPAFNASAQGGITTIGGSPIPQRTLRTSPSVGGVPVGGVPAGTTVAPQTVQQATPFSREEAEILVEAKRLYYQQQKDDRGKIMPSTDLSSPRQPLPQ